MTPRQLPVLSGPEIVRALERAGFVVRRVRGSHHILAHCNHPDRVVTVPVHGRKELPRGTLQSIVDQSGLSVDDFRRLL